MSTQSKKHVPTSAAPTSYLYREVRPDWPALFENLAEGVGKFSPDKWPEIVPHLYHTLSALFRLKPKTVSEEAFLLVKKALTRAVLVVVEACGVPANNNRAANPDLSKRLDQTLREVPIELTQSFFTNPTRATIVGKVARQLASWLRIRGFEDIQAEQGIAMFPANFVASLAYILETEASQYSRLVEKHDPQFQQLAEQYHVWDAYHSHLQTLANPEVLDLGVSLDEVYVELRAYTQPSTQGTGGVHIRTHLADDKQPRTIGHLKDMAEAWIDDPADAIFVVSGGPGSGKSAFARRFAAWRAWAGPDPWRVLYVPLHRFNASSEIRSALEQFAAREAQLQDSRTLDLFQTDATENERLLIVFDGLDELSQQGAVGEEVAGKFYQSIDGFVKEINGDRKPVRMKVMVSGRPVAVSSTDAELRKAERVRHLLPYQIPERFHDQTEWRGQSSLATVDQRDEWWKKYGQATGQTESVGMPDFIRTENLDPLTAEPILNGLIAKCLKHPDRTITSETNRAELYEWMLDDILARIHDPNGGPIISNAKQQDVAVLLEEVAVAAWHNGDIRATTKSRVKAHCEKCGQSPLLNTVFPDQAKSNISPLFLAFYFQEAHERIGQERAFEFSHKSYGEFLLARRIVRFFRDLHEWLDKRAWTVEDALKHWAKLFGPTGVTSEIHDFVTDIVNMEDEEVRNTWRKDFVTLFETVIRSGMPMHQLGLTSYQEMARQDRNAITAIFVMHSACHRTGDVVIPVGWPECSMLDEVKGDFLVRLLGQDVPGSLFRGRYLCGWDWNNTDLFGANLFAANLFGANLISVNLVGANLMCANLVGADINSSALSGANLRSSNLYGADLTDVDLRDANLLGTFVTHEQLLTTIGDPAIMMDGKPPKKNWRKAKAPRKTSSRKKPTPSTGTSEPQK